MIWNRLVKNIANAHYDRQDRMANLIGWGIATHVVMAFGVTCASVGGGNGYALVTFPMLIISGIDYLNTGYKTLNIKERNEELSKRARLLAKDRSLDADWKRRAQTVYTLTRKVNEKEKRYGNYPEIDKAKVELNKAIDCIVKHSMMIHTTHAEIVQRDVDSILSAYAEL